MRCVMLEVAGLNLLRFIAIKRFPLLAGEGELVQASARKLQAYGFLPEWEGEWLLTDLERYTLDRLANVLTESPVEVLVAD